VNNQYTLKKMKDKRVNRSCTGVGSDERGRERKRVKEGDYG
jgi:hypothetical protein